MAEKGPSQFQDHTVCKVSAVSRRKKEQMIFQGSRMVLDICGWIEKSRPDDVRWDKVEHVKRILTGETYPVSPKQIAAKLIEHMLEHGHANQHKQRESSGETEDSSGVAKATIAGQAKPAR
jgi:anti-sigma28 factor (negative regulator of flagellin synthesis)